MKQVYTASHPLEAHLVKGILQTNGIDCEVRGEHLFSIRGEIPIAFDTLPSVWILDDKNVDQAKRIIEDYEQTRSPEATDNDTWTCSTCGEQSESQFTECWKCGTSRF